MTCCLTFIVSKLLACSESESHTSRRSVNTTIVYTDPNR